MRRRKGAKPSEASLLLASIASNTDNIAAKVLLRLNAAEIERDQYLKELTFLRKKLTSLLTKDQLEAARICCVTPEMYAIELIDLWRHKQFPSFTPDIQHYGALTGNTPK
jgi:hypothetical protein